MAGLVAGKRALILGVGNKRSIAWGIAQALHGAGARVAFNYMNDRFKPKVEELAAELGDGIPLWPCDVGSDAEIDALFQAVDEHWGGLDVLVHSLAFAPAEALESDFANTSRSAWTTALDISAYSLVAVAQRARPLFQKAGGGSVITMTYIGSERAVPAYNVMGVAKAALESAVRYLALNLGPEKVRVNAISAGPIKTLSAMGVKGFSNILKVVEEKAPLRRNVTPEDVGNVGLFLASDLSAAVTGEVLFVDSGYHILGV